MIRYVCQSRTRTDENLKSTIMMLIFCFAFLRIIIVKGGYVDIVLQSDNFTSVINLTTDGYTGFFSKLVQIELPVCQFGYVFGVTTVNVSSTTCSSLNITDVGESFECGEVNSTIFQCERMGKTSYCENNKSWFVFYNSDSTSSKQCAGICLTNTSETFNVSYQQNITRVPESACPRPTDTTTKTPSTAKSTISETPTSKSAASVTSHISTQSTQLIPGNSTFYVNDEANKKFKESIPLIAGLCTGGGVLIIIIVVVIIVCVRKRTTRNRKNIHKTTEKDPYVGDTDAVYDICDEKTRDSSIHNGRELYKLSGIDFDVMDDSKAAGNETTQTNHKDMSRSNPGNLQTDSVEQVNSDLNNKHNPSYITTDKDNGYLEVIIPHLENTTNDDASSTSHSDSNEIDRGYELVGGTKKNISTIYARLGDSIKEFENPYNETLDKDNNLKETDAAHVNVNVKINPRRDTPDTLKISPGPDHVIVVEEPMDVYAQVMKTKKPHVAISYV